MPFLLPLPVPEPQWTPGNPRLPRSHSPGPASQPKAGLKKKPQSKKMSTLTEYIYSLVLLVTVHLLESNAQQHNKFLFQEGYIVEFLLKLLWREFDFV